MNNGNEDNSLTSEMVGLYTEKHKGRVIRLVDTMPDLMTLPRTYLGSFAWTNKTHRYIKRFRAKPIADTYWTSADIARTYLEVRYSDDRRRTTTEAYCYCFQPKPKSVPMYAKPTKGDLVYVDLKAAYWSILEAVGWNVEYSPGKYVGKRSDNSDFPYQDDKLARNILVSSGLKRRVAVWTGRRLTTINGRNPLYNGILWCLVQDVLHGVATDMLVLGAVYVHTDGYILPAKLATDAIGIADNWGLHARVKYMGGGEVLGPSNYWIEGKPLRRPKPAKPKVHENVRPPKSMDWLRLRIFHMRKRFVGENNDQ